jgi:hypothetical protein
MTNQYMYQDGVLTAREVMTEPDGARLMWRAAWRLTRRAAGREYVEDSLLRHHTARVEVRRRVVECAGRAASLSSGSRMSLSGDAR